jgi:hypothetical protein
MRVRRWHGAEAIRGPGSPTHIENGIAIRFDGDCFRTGDYWLIPARAASQSFEPLDHAPPRGVHHHFAKLALLTPPSKLRDLRAQGKKMSCQDRSSFTLVGLFQFNDKHPVLTRRVVVNAVRLIGLQVAIIDGGNVGPIACAYREPHPEMISGVTGKIPCS